MRESKRNPGSASGPGVAPDCQQAAAFCRRRAVALAAFLLRSSFRTERADFPDAQLDGHVGAVIDACVRGVVPFAAAQFTFDHYVIAIGGGMGGFGEFCPSERPDAKSGRDAIRPNPWASTRPLVASDSTARSSSCSGARPR